MKWLASQPAIFFTRRFVRWPDSTQIKRGMFTAHTSQQTESTTQQHLAGISNGALNCATWKSMNLFGILRYGKMGSKKILKNCCKTSWIWAQTCLAKNQVVAGLRNDEVENGQYFYFLQENLYKLRVLPRPKANLFCESDVTPVYGVISRNFHPIRSYYLRRFVARQVWAKTRNVAFQLVLQQFCTFLLPVLAETGL